MPPLITCFRNVSYQEKRLISFEQNLMAQSTYTDKETGQSELVIVFKHVGLEEKLKALPYKVFGKIRSYMANEDG